MTNFDTVRDVLRIMTNNFIDDDTRIDLALEALKALDAIEADQFSAHDMASAAAQGFRDGVASVTQGEPVGTVVSFVRGGYTEWGFTPEKPAWDIERNQSAIERRATRCFAVYAAPVAQQLVSSVVIRDGLPTLLQDRDIKDTDVRLYRPAPVAQQPQAEPDWVNGVPHWSPALIAKVKQMTAELDEPKQPQAEAVPSDEAVVAGARVLNQRAAASCGINADDQWALYAEDFKNDVRAVLAAAQGAKK